MTLIDESFCVRYNLSGAFFVHIHTLSSRGAKVAAGAGLELNDLSSLPRVSLHVPPCCPVRSCRRSNPFLLSSITLSLLYDDDLARIYIEVTEDIANTALIVACLVDTVMKLRVL